MTGILRHKKTGGLYEVLFRGVRVRADAPLTDYDLVQVVQDKMTGDIFACAPGCAPSSASIILAATVQSKGWLRQGDEVAVYRPPNTSLVWARPTSEMDDGRFEPAQAIEARQGGDAEGGSVEDKSAVAAGDVPASKSEVQTPSSTPGAAERLVGQLIEAARAFGWSVDLGSPTDAHRAMLEEKAARTALLSYISTAGRGEGAGDLAALSKKATQGEWHVESEKTDGSYGSGEDCSEGYHTAVICTDEIRHGKPGVIFEGSNSTVAEIEEENHEDGFYAWDAVSKANAEFIVALVNAYRSGRLVERPAATNPQDQE